MLARGGAGGAPFGRAAAPRQARSGPDGAGHPPRPHGGAREAARVPGRRPHRRPDRRRLHRARRRSLGTLRHPAGALGRRDRRQRGDLHAPGGSGAANGRAAGGAPQRRVARHVDGAAVRARAPSDRGPAARARRLPPALGRGRADLAARAALSRAAGLRLGGDRGRRRARRHRPDLQPAHGALDTAGLRAAAADRPHDAAPHRHRRRPEDVEVARQPHRRDRGSPARCTAGR